MKRTFTSLSVFMFLTVVASIAETATAGVSFSVRFFDKTVYYTDSDIRVKATISNKTPETYRFKLAEDKLFSVRFDVRTLSNRSLDSSEILLKAESSSKAVFFREVSILPGEEYSFDAVLGDFVAIRESGTYRFSLDFYPELVRGRETAPPLHSNILELSVRPGAGVAPVQDKIDTITHELVRAQKMPPDEVVKRVLEARQNERWNEYFLYLDLEKMLVRNPERKKQYDLSSEDARVRMKERYRRELMEKIVDKDISVVPAWFEITETQYQTSSGLVRVLEKFDSFLDETVRGNFYLVKEYEYELQKRDGIWYITGYTVINRGTEAKTAGK